MNLYSTKVENGSFAFNGSSLNLMSNAQDNMYFSFPYTSSGAATLLTTAHTGSIGSYPTYAYPVLTYGSQADRIYVLSGMNPLNPASRGCIYNTSLSLNTQFGTSTTGTFSFTGPKSVVPSDSGTARYVYFTYGADSRGYSPFHCTRGTPSISGDNVTWSFTYRLCSTSGYAPSKVYVTVVLIEWDGQT